MKTIQRLTGQRTVSYPTSMRQLQSDVFQLKKKTKGIEYKTLDTQLFDATQDVIPINSALGATPPMYGLLNAVPGGTLDGERIGDSIQMKSIYLRYIIYVGTTANGNVRVILAFNKNNENGLVVPPATIVQRILRIGPGPGAGAFNSAAIASVRQQDFRDTYIVLYDKVHNFGFQSVRGSLHVKKKITLNLEAKYLSALNTAITTGGLHFMAFSDMIASEQPTMGASARLIYTDS